MTRYALPLSSLLLMGIAASIGACASTGIAIREQLGYAKREQLVDRVQDARDEQAEAKEQFATTLEEFRALTGFRGGDLERVYNKLNREYERSRDAAGHVSNRIRDVERVASAMFREWEDELDQYTSDSFRDASERQLRETQARYDDLVRAMQRAEGRMGPVLDLFGDQVLFLKHNLNARAIGSLDTTVDELEDEIDRLIAEMNVSIEEADAFIAELGSTG
ncbi:MAG: DNA repair protein [Phycisphaerae bacterium]|nr:DNA repair protein [Phycisphaerae bacterium]